MKKAKIQYFTLKDEMLKEEKLEWFSETKLEDIPFERINPDKNNNWIDLVNNDFEELLALVNKQTKLSKNKSEEKAVFKLFSNGTVSNRDEWIYDIYSKNLEDKMMYFSNLYNNLLKKNKYDDAIKWSETLKTNYQSNKKSEFKKKFVVSSLFRPFTKRNYYSEKIFNDRLTQNHYDTFGYDFESQNKCICLQGIGIERLWHCIGSKYLPHLQIVPNGQYISLYRYDEQGTRIENITDWGLKQFQNHYKYVETLHATSLGTITKTNIFHYTYAVLHNPAYRKKYKLNLKREFPRLPFYKNFEKWAKWGEELMDLHINYEKVKKYNLEVIEMQNPKINPKAKLRRNKDTNEIILDENTTLKGIPAVVFDYKLGNRSAIDWILDQHKEKKPRDKTIAEKFNTYKFADYKDKVIDLIARVSTVSLETVKITKLMEIEENHA